MKQNIIANQTNILTISPEYSITHCIPAYLQYNTILSKKLIQMHGNMLFILKNIELIPGGTTTIVTVNRTIQLFNNKR